MLLLGSLVEMSHGGETITHLVTWRGKNGLGILDLLIEIWRKEEFLTKVHRTSDGIIQGTFTSMLIIIIIMMI